MTEDAFQIVRDVCGAWAAAFRARDFVALVALYDPDALFFGSAPDLCIGHAAIRAYFEQLPAGIELTEFPPQCVRALAPGVLLTSGFWTFALGGERLEFRLSWTLVERDWGWRIGQHHAGLKPKARLAAAAAPTSR